MEQVTIVLPTYNGATYLRQSIDSCLNQTYTNLELIVVDGGSTDGTVDILQSYSDPRLLVLHQPVTQGRLKGGHGCLVFFGCEGRATLGRAPSLSCTRL